MSGPFSDGAKSAFQATATVAPPSMRSSGRRVRRLGRRYRQQTKYFYLFVTPWLLGFVCLGLFTIVLGLLMSFTNYDGFNLETVRWVGAANYKRVLADPEVRYSFGRTLAFLLVAVPGTVLIQLNLALLLNHNVKGRGLFRTLFYLPSIIPVVASVWVWKAAAMPEGLINQMIRLFTGVDQTTFWLVDHPGLILRIFVLWAWAGGGMLIFLAALQDIPPELREAAMIDGASTFQATRKIIVPLLTPVIFFQLVMTTFLAFQIVVEPMLLTPGLGGLANPPPRENNVFAFAAFQEAFVNQRFGYSAAMLWILFLTAFLAGLALFATSRLWVYYEPRRRTR